MAKEKTVNYTEQDVATLREMYTGADNKAEIAAIAEVIGKSENSVRAKAVSERIYVAEAAKAKGKRVTRAQKAEVLVTELFGDEATESDFENVSKLTVRVLDALTANIVSADE